MDYSINGTGMIGHSFAKIRIKIRQSAQKYILGRPKR